RPASSRGKPRWIWGYWGRTATAPTDGADCAPPAGSSYAERSLGQMPAFPCRLGDRDRPAFAVDDEVADRDALDGDDLDRNVAVAVKFGPAGMELTLAVVGQPARHRLLGAGEGRLSLAGIGDADRIGDGKRRRQQEQAGKERRRD